MSQSLPLVTPVTNAEVSAAQRLPVGLSAPVMKRRLPHAS